ncbi:MAG TPA: organomercurial lyase [Anaerolineales bacterium]|jgi:hypothetical protein
MQTLDLEVRRLVYEHFLTTGRAPTSAGLAGELAVTEPYAANALGRLAGDHMLVLKPSSTEILMAHPFSAVPTDFEVVAADKNWWANCVWDALGILVMTGQDGRVETTCPDCGEPLKLEVVAGELAATEAIAHFAVPAADWWEDIVFT